MMCEYTSASFEKVPPNFRAHWQGSYATLSGVVLNQAVLWQVTNSSSDSECSSAHPARRSLMPSPRVGKGLDCKSRKVTSLEVELSHCKITSNHGNKNWGKAKGVVWNKRLPIEAKLYNSRIHMEKHPQNAKLITAEEGCPHDPAMRKWTRTPGCAICKLRSVTKRLSYSQTITKT